MRRIASAISSSLTVTSWSMPVAGDGKRVGADVRHGEAVGERGLAVDLHGRAVRHAAANFAAPSGSTPMILHLRPQRLHRQRDPGQQPRAAHGDRRRRRRRAPVR